MKRIKKIYWWIRFTYNIWWWGHIAPKKHPGNDRYFMFKVLSLELLRDYFWTR